MGREKIKNMDEFAAKSGISRPTISKYFNDPNSVRASTRKRIEEAIDKFDYRPNLYAINQNRRLTKTIGVVVPYLSDPFFAEIARHIEDHLILAGYRPVVLGSHGKTTQEIDNLDNLRLLRPAGVLLAPLGRASDPDQIARFCDDVPTVFFDNRIQDFGAAYYGLNNQNSVRLIVDHLCRTGEPPAFFEMRVPSNPNAIKRRNAYVAAMEANGHTPHLLQVEGDGWEFEDIGFHGAARVLNGGELPSNTVLCSNDRLAIGFLSAAYQRGLRVGIGEGCALRVAGHDDHPFSRFTCPTLTTVAQDYESIAQHAAHALVELIEAEKTPEKRDDTLFDGRLVLRGSA